MMMNCELTNLLYCMLLENDYLQSQVKKLHLNWINEAQCNWKKLWVCFIYFIFLKQLNFLILN